MCRVFKFCNNLRPHIRLLLYICYILNLLVTVHPYDGSHEKPNHVTEGFKYTSCPRVLLLLILVTSVSLFKRLCQLTRGFFPVSNLYNTVLLSVHFLPSPLICQSYLTNKLSPRNGVLLEKLTGAQLVEKFPTFYGIR
jgi:hypothetical protein